MQMYDRQCTISVHERHYGELADRMRPLTQNVDVMIERVPLRSRWASERWQPVAIEIAPTTPGFVPDRNAVPGSHLCVFE